MKGIFKFVASNCKMGTLNSTANSNVKNLDYFSKLAVLVRVSQLLIEALKLNLYSFYTGYINNIVNPKNLMQRSRCQLEQIIQMLITSKPS